MSPERWERGAQHLLRAADARIRVVSTCTPRNLAAELDDLAQCFARGEPRAPRFSYRHVDFSDQRRLLEQAAEQLGGAGALGDLYADRARELALEAAICTAVGTPAMQGLAVARYRTSPAADALATAWHHAAVPAPRAEHRSDDERDPASLVCRLREEVGRLRLPIRVRVMPHLAALAATGSDVIGVAAGRWMSSEDVERTVLHEIEGHALPRVRAHGLLDVGTAYGSDDQEGRAIALEEAAGWLGAGRRRELALRHVAALSMRAGADFVETVRCLNADLHDALRVTARVFRGGGLGRELGYLTGFVRYREASPPVQQLMGFGRVSVAAATVLCGMYGSAPPYHDEMVMNRTASSGV